MLATSTRRTLAAQAEGGGQLDRADLVRGRRAEDVRARSPRPADRAVARRQAPSRQRAHERAARRLDPDDDSRGPRELERRRDPPARRAGREEPESVVERELAVGYGVTAEVVVGDDVKRPRSFGLAGAGPGEAIRPRGARPGVHRDDDAAGTVER